MNFEENFEEFGKEIDDLQSTKLNKVELNALYLTTSNQLDVINKVKTNSLEPKELDKYLKELKAEQKKDSSIAEDDSNIFGVLEEDTTKIKKLIKNLIIIILIPLYFIVLIIKILIQKIIY